MKITQFTVQIDSTTQADTYLTAMGTDGQTPVGVAVVGIEEAENTGWISRVFVSPEVRRKGIGKVLMQAAIKFCRAQGRQFASLMVKDDNTGAQELYKALGFKPFMKGSEGYMQYIKTL